MKEVEDLNTIGPVLAHLREKKRHTMHAAERESQRERERLIERFFSEENHAHTEERA